MYRILYKYEDSYAVLNTDTLDVEAFFTKDLEFLVQSGVGIVGAKKSGGAVTFSNDIVEFNPSYMDESYEFEDDEEDEEFFDFDDEDEGEIVDEFEDEEDSDISDEYFFDIEDEGDIVDEFEDEDASVVEKLYNHLTDSQVKLLKRYYLWYSRRIFSDAQKDPTLGMKDMRRLQAKKASLNVLRDSGGLWEYAGFIDTGYDGGGECTMGHTLRYMHLAWDVSKADLDEAFFGERYTNDIEEALHSSNCIVFGIKCVSDFFEVDKDCIQSLQRAQRESLKDMQEIFELYEAGEVENNVNSFALMDELIKKIVTADARAVMLGDGVTILPKGLHDFYQQFRQEQMPVPRSLIYEIRNQIMGFEAGNYYGTIKIPTPKFRWVLQQLYGKKFTSVEQFLNYGRQAATENYISAFLHILVGYEVCGYYKYDGAKNTYEGGKSKSVRYLFAELNRRGGSLFSDSEYTFNFFENLLGYYANFQKLLKKWEAVSDRDDTIDRRISRLRMTLRIGTGSIGTYAEGVQELEELSDSINELARKKEAEKIEPENIYEYLCSADLSSVKNDPDYAFPLQVLESCQKYNKVSDKQMVYLEKLYEKVSGKPSAIAMIKKQMIKDLMGCDLSHLDEKVRDIIKTVNDKGTVPTTKQLWHIKRAYESTEDAHKESLNLLRRTFDCENVPDLLKGLN